MKRLLDTTAKGQEYLDDKKESLTSDLYNKMSLNFKETHNAIKDEASSLYKIEYSYQKTVVIPFRNADDEEDADYKILNVTGFAVCMLNNNERGTVPHLIQNMCVYKSHWLKWTLPSSFFGEKGDLFVIKEMIEIGHILPP